MKTSEVLFNLDNLNIKEKRLVIVEGAFDALTASYLSKDQVKQNYGFVACGKNCLSEKQAELIKNKGYSQAILFLDNDKAGLNFFNSANKLREHNITPFIVQIPNEYKVKDLDELVRKQPEANLQEMLDNAKYAVDVQIDLIIKNNSKNHQSITDIERDTIIKECSSLQSLLLTSEHYSYYELMKKKLNIGLNMQTESVQEMVAEKKLYTGNNSSLEIAKFKEEVRQGKMPDIHEFRKFLNSKRKNHLESKIKKEIEELKEESEGKGNALISMIEEYQNLAVNYEEDKPYTHDDWLNDAGKSSDGMKTGFEGLDQHVSIEPGTLVFIAGRPGHGKTTFMLSMLRNMIKANPDKSFMFYSYEETEADIMLKIVLGMTAIDSELNSALNKKEGSTFWAKIKNHFKEYALAVINKENEAIERLPHHFRKAYEEVKNWIDEESIQLLKPKPNVELLSAAIIDRVRASKKPVAAIFIDYTQKLRTEEQKANRQQELQRICQLLHNITLDKRVKAPIILGAQVNREVKSLETFTLDTMREAGDIEQDANLILGVWDKTVTDIDKLKNKLASLEEDKSKSNSEEIKDVEKQIKEERQAIENNTGTTKTVKILKNRNGENNVSIPLYSYSRNFLITDKI